MTSSTAAAMADSSETCCSPLSALIASVVWPGGPAWRGPPPPPPARARPHQRRCVLRPEGDRRRAQALLPQPPQQLTGDPVRDGLGLAGRGGRRLLVEGGEGGVRDEDAGIVVGDAVLRDEARPALGRHLGEGRAERLDALPPRLGRGPG